MSNSELVRVIPGDFRGVPPSEVDGLVDLVLTDPPYGNLFKHTRRKFQGFVVTGDGLDWLEDFFQMALRALKPGAPMILHADHKGFSRFERAGNSVGFRLVNIAIWDKKNIAIGYNFRPQHELLMLFSTKKSIRATNRNLPSVLTYPRVPKKVHPTQKPVPLLRRLVEEFSKPGDLVLDPFMGSGSTAIACIETDRRFIGSELLPEYVTLANIRINDALRERQAA